jgi:hypothetical protein
MNYNRKEPEIFPYWAEKASIIAALILIFYALLFMPGGGNSPSCARSMFLKCLVCEDGKYSYYPPGTPYGPGSPSCYHAPDRFISENK